MLSIGLKRVMWLCVLYGLAAPVPSASLPDRVDYNHHIRPLLSDRCYSCHGPDEKARKAKLRLDLKEGAFKGLDDGMFVIKPGDLAKSELSRRISSTDPDDKMPPPDSHLSLIPDEIELIKRWIAQGAEWSRHWAFIPLAPVDVPAIKKQDWVVNDIDRFILHRLQKEGFTPSTHASKERLLRRVTFDLTGLPPTLVEIDEFLADSAPAAYERVVDRLLASNAYGERMAVEWLDVARYADTYGYQADRFNHLWPWRDWVIEAFNRNIPFDDFIIWQLAGDLLPNATREQKLATAFNRLHRQTNEGGSVEEEFRVEYVADRVHTAAGAFLGLTMECARCHDHKYDPISQKDYYRLFAFFNSTDESGLYSHFTDAIPSPTLLLFKDAAQEQMHQELKRAIADKEGELEKRTNSALLAGTGLIGHYAFDTISGNKAANALGTNFSAKLNDTPALVEGHLGKALQFNGENSVTIDKIADFKRTDPFSFTFWLKVPEELPEIVVLHHQQAGSDAGYHGYQFVLENGYPTFGLIHFWPGNAIKVRGKDKLSLNQWIHVGITYDGSSRARGISLYFDGSPAEVEVLRDSLFKDIVNGQPLTLAARFRGRGLKDGAIDELKVFNRALTPADVRQQIRKGDSLSSSVGDFDQQYSELMAELKTLRDQENNLINSVPEIMVMGDLPTPRSTHVLKRGMYDAPGEVVTPGAPDSILPFDSTLPTNRLGLARWVVDRRNPLTARVIVNRYWQMFFGNGIVETSDNLGSQGTLPSHPELLDWLASGFIESGWDLKALQKLIVMSGTYRQSSQTTSELLAKDPENRLLSRGPKTRLSAEMLRDQALAASGLLVSRVGGPSVKPYQPEGLWEEKSSGWKYEPDKAAGLYRRGLYTYWKRTVPHPSMIAFDAAERNNCTVRRQNTSTPLQSLVLLNDPQFVEAARKIGERAIKEAGPAVKDRILFMFRLLTSRRPSDRELAILKVLYSEQLQLFQSETPAELLKVGDSAWDKSISSSELAAYASVALAILNHDDAVLKR